MYQNIYCRRHKKFNEVHLWDDKTGYTKFNVKSYAYKKYGAGTYKSLYGDNLKRVQFWTHDDVEKNKIFESDVPIETRILIDKYGDSDDIATGHRELYFDIETESSAGFPDWRLADQPITSIALYDKTTDDYFVYTCTQSSEAIAYTKDNVSVELFTDEGELLQRFFQKYIEIAPTVLSGWNVDGFDIPYLYNRTVVVLGSEIANALSPISIVNFNDRQERFKIAGVSVLDYLTLYKKFTFKQQPSYRLDYIGELEVGQKKVSYDGSLTDLYLNEINKFIEYNLQDVKLIVKLNEKLDFITLAMGVSHLGHISYEDVVYSSRYIEGAMLTYMRRIGVVAPNKAPKSNVPTNIKYVGAYVKDPIPGKHKWIYDLDITSMYPSIIMSMNISPEMKLGKLDGWDIDEYLKGTDKVYDFIVDGKIKRQYNTSEVKTLLDINKISIAVTGVMYNQEKTGLIPAILSKWFNERKEYRKLSKKYHDAGDQSKSEYFNRRQYIQKILLNTVYGVFGLPIFRFYDTDNSEAITLTGQHLIKYSQKMVNYIYNKELNVDKDHVVYIDTDSIFASALPIIKHRYPKADYEDEQFMTSQVLGITSYVQKFLNDSYDLFAQRFLNIKGPHKFDIKQEVIAKRAFWVTKKRYAQKIINDNGIACDRLDIKGLDVIKSSFAPSFQKLMMGVLVDILGDVDKSKIDNDIMSFKSHMKTLPIDEIASPTGISNIKKFIRKSDSIATEFNKGTPIHVKSSVRYNDLLKYLKVSDEYTPINSGEKVKWIYLKPNSLNYKSIAFKGYDDPIEILDFIKTYIDYDTIFDNALYKKVKIIYEALSWTEPIDTKVSLERFF